LNILFQILNIEYDAMTKMETFNWKLLTL